MVSSGRGSRHLGLSIPHFTIVLLRLVCLQAFRVSHSAPPSPPPSIFSTPSSFSSTHGSPYRSNFHAVIAIINRGSPFPEIYLDIESIPPLRGPILRISRQEDRGFITSGNIYRSPNDLALKYNDIIPPVHVFFAQISTQPSHVYLFPSAHPIYAY